jgi:hypothetical protein
MHPAGGDVSPATAYTARANKTLGPTLRRQVPGTLSFVAELQPELIHVHDVFSFEGFRLFHARILSLFIRLIKVNIHKKRYLNEAASLDHFRAPRGLL